MLRNHAEKSTVLNLRDNEQFIYWKKQETSGVVCVEITEVIPLLQDKPSASTSQEVLQLRLHDAQAVDNLIEALKQAREAMPQD